MSEISSDISSQIKGVENSLSEADKFIKTLQSLDYDEVTTKLAPLDRAKYDLTIVYAINSLFWTLKRSYGEDPQSHGIKDEMDRIKQQMLRLKEIADKEKMPRVNKEVAERIVRHELNLRRGKKRRKEEDESWDDEKKETN